MHNFVLQFKPSDSYICATCLTGTIPQAREPFDFKKVPWNRSYALLQHLAANGSISWEGKPLLIDFFSKVQFFYEVAKLKNGELHLSGKLFIKKEIPLDSCRFIASSNPTWFIFENQLKVITTDISASELSNLPRLIDGKELEDLAEEAKEPNAPEVKVLFEGDSIPDPTPLLTLTDRKGAFANLMMLYGKEKQFQVGDQTKIRERKIQAESYWEKDLLETGYIKKIVDKSSYYCPLDKVGKSISFLLELGWKIQDANQNEVIQESSRDLTSKELKDRIELTGTLNFGDYQADLSKVFGAFNKRERFIDLGCGKVGLLEENDPLAIVAEEIEAFGASFTVKKNQLGLLENWDIPLHLHSILSRHSLDSTPSQGFQGSLRPYQKEGLSWLMHLHASNLHGILADEMGLGKTVQVIAFLSLRNSLEKHLIVVPTSLLFNWEREVTRFLPSIPIYKHHGTTRAQDLPKSGVILTSYHTLINDLELFKDRVWDSIILDEAQVVKNPDSQLARGLYTLKSTFRLAMTGTIIENHAKELYAHFHFLMPGMLGTRDLFEQQLSLATVDSRYVKKIKNMIRPFILRRKKEEVVKDLPPLEEYIAYVEMPPSQRSAYDQFLAATKQGLLKKIKTDGAGKHRMEIFEAILRLRQIACSPLLVAHLLPDPQEESGKLQALFMDLEAIWEEGKKALIFSQFSSMLHLIAKKLNEKKIPYCLLEGATTDRETPVNRFQEDPSVPFFLLTLKAGGVGLNLTAADYVLLYDPWWHEAIDAQAISRAHRIGQTKPVIAKRYITLESIEEKMLTLKKAKAALFNNLLEKDFGEPPLSEEDFTYLLE